MKYIIESALSTLFPPKAGRVESYVMPAPPLDPFAMPAIEDGIVSAARPKPYRNGIDRMRRMQLAESIAAFENWQFQEMEKDLCEKPC